jgi:hypothetical protein
VRLVPGVRAKVASGNGCRFDGADLPDGAAVADALEAAAVAARVSGDWLDIEAVTPLGLIPTGVVAAASAEAALVAFGVMSAEAVTIEAEEVE